MSLPSFSGRDRYIRPWQLPIFVLAGSITAGAIGERYQPLPPLICLASALVCIGFSLFLLSRRAQAGAVLSLALGAAGLGAAYYHHRIESCAPDDISGLASQEPRPIQARGVLDDEPALMAGSPSNAMLSLARADATVCVFAVSAVRIGDDWRPASGYARLNVAGRLSDIHAGDEIELVGRLSTPRGAENPGERDDAAFLKDRGIRSTIAVVKTADAVTRLRRGWTGTPIGWLGMARSRAHRVLTDTLADEQVGLAAALLLGEGTALPSAEWQKYLRTGVIHVLAISGQHLAILAMFFWWAQRIFLVQRRHAALFVCLFLAAYAVLTGMQPPALRAAVMIGLECLGLVIGLQALGLNSLALAWLVVFAINPADMFSPGCQLSFLSVAFLNLGLGTLISREAKPSDPLAVLIHKSRPRWEQLLRNALSKVGAVYCLTLLMWVALAPLVAWHFHTLSLAGILIGPPVILLSTFALLSGFLLFGAALVCPFMIPPFALALRLSLGACDALVRWAESLPGSFCYLPDLPLWWIYGFYTALLVFLLYPFRHARRRWALPVAVLWLTIGLLCTLIRPGLGDALRCTFLAVGHGGCAVLETPDGRTLIYDVGSLSGPDIARRQVAPYLWHRGIRRIDEVFLSHADIDHFNGLLELAARFAIGQVTCTPTFDTKETESARATLAGLHQRGIPVRIARAGDRFTSGNVTIDVLHPPATGPEGNENTRSLVLLIRHLGHSILLTGDLEGAGQACVLALPAPPLDVLMAPHHGSAAANKADLATWAHPRVVVSCEGPPRGPMRPPEPYSGMGARFFGTWPHGALTLRSHTSGLILETYVSKQLYVVRRGGE
jgi:competence protein ComEC